MNWSYRKIGSALAAKYKTYSPSMINGQIIFTGFNFIQRLQ